MPVRLVSSDVREHTDTHTAKIKKTILLENYLFGLRDELK